jgi:hypothetical protein
VGTWGVAIFSDDLAADVRGDWRDGVLEGHEPLELTARLEAEYAAAIADADESSVFWLALAAAQMETGRLLDEVRDRAVMIVDSGIDVARWQAEDETLAAARQKVLARLRDKLTGPQPKPKRLRHPRNLAVPFDLGDVVLVHGREGVARALFVVVDQVHGHPRGAIHPVVEGLFWDGIGPTPTADDIRRLPTMLSDGAYRRPDGEWNPIVGAPRPHLIVVLTVRKEGVFTSSHGEVVARGLLREPSGDYRKGALDRRAPCVTTYSSWPTMATWIEGTAFRHELDVTRGALSKESAGRVARMRRRWRRNQ